MKSVVKSLEIQSSKRQPSEIKTSEIRSLKDSTLLQRTQDLASEERRITAELIEHLREIERRKLYADCGCPSLFNYCIKILKLSEGSAQRRINALRLSKDVPELNEKLRSGEISLSVASQVQTFFRQESKSAPVSLDLKKAIVEQVAGKSSREAEIALLEHSSQPERHVPETVRPLSATHSQVQFTVDQQQLALFERARGLLAHAHPQMNWSELFTAMAKVVIEKLDPAKQLPRRTVSPTRRQTSSSSRSMVNVREGKVQDTKMEAAIAQSTRVSAPEMLFLADLREFNIVAAKNRRPSAALERAVWRRDRSQCVLCKSVHALEVDHVIPWALGGLTTLANARLLCRSCNQRERVRWFGRVEFKSAVTHVR